MSDAIIDWNDLSDENKTRVARQIYTPAFTTQFAYPNRDLHPKIEVAVGHRCAKIDVKLADIVRWLWNNCMDTVGSCENRSGDRIDGGDSAWISFLSPEHGATRFSEFLEASGIPFSASKNTFVARLNLEEPNQRVLLRMPVVNFRPQDVDRIREAIAARQQFLPEGT